MCLFSQAAPPTNCTNKRIQTYCETNPLPYILEIHILLDVTIISDSVDVLMHS